MRHKAALEEAIYFCLSGTIVRYRVSWTELLVRHLKVGGTACGALVGFREGLELDYSPG